MQRFLSALFLIAMLGCVLQAQEPVDDVSDSAIPVFKIRVRLAEPEDQTPEPDDSIARLPKPASIDVQPQDAEPVEREVASSIVDSEPARPIVRVTGVRPIEINPEDETSTALPDELVPNEIWTEEEELVSKLPATNAAASQNAGRPTFRWPMLTTPDQDGLPIQIASTAPLQIESGRGVLPAPRGLDTPEDLDEPMLDFNGMPDIDISLDSDQFLDPPDDDSPFDLPPLGVAKQKEKDNKYPPLWWRDKVTAPMFDDSRSHVGVSLDQLVFGALINSKKITIAKLDGFVEQERVTQAGAEFDWTAFAETIFTETNQKTGSDLDAGDNIAQLEQLDLNNKAGLRRKNRKGGQFSAEQTMQLLQSNSQFLNPADQALTQLTLRYTQPLLKEGGFLVNQGKVVLAQLNANAKTEESQAEIADITTQVVEEYWRIYQFRSRYVVQDRLIRVLRSLLTEIKKRSKIDARQSLIGQAEAELANQIATQAQTRNQIRQSQLQLVRLVGDRSLGHCDELIPTTHAALPYCDPNPSTALLTAMTLRPEIRAAALRIEGSELFKDIRKRQLLPKLALLLETSVNGVNGDFDVTRSIGDQFSEGAPTYSAGLIYELPLGNRLAVSRLRESQLLLAREVANFEDTVDQITLDVNSSITGLSGVRRQYTVRQESILRAKEVVDSLLKRRNIFPEKFDQISQLYAREILDAHQRVTTAESEQIDLLFDYSQASIQLRRAMGSLLSQYEEALPIDYFPTDLAADPNGMVKPRIGGRIKRAIHKKNKSYDAPPRFGMFP